MISLGVLTSILAHNVDGGSFEIECKPPSDEQCFILRSGNWTAGAPIVVHNLGNKTDFRLFVDCKWKSFPSVLFERYPFLTRAYIWCDIEPLSSEDFKDASNLEILNLYSNRFSRIRSNTFAYLTKVTSLSLEYNAIDELDERAFSGMAEQIDLRLPSNKLTSLKRNTFAGAPKLREILLHWNRISSIEEGTFELPELVTLNLRNNKLTGLPDNLFQNAVKLSNLNLASNYFDGIPPALFSTSITEVNLDRNPLIAFKLADLAKMKNSEAV